ncbi:hypothetical protein D9758_009959 [Tetrapyrgos nigripes]|uniref:TauD/TfdA-like domain-containing protein n=1 Tax=Tetrapyrgos nigripes TaxID=182062 RepID=A0A8H5CRM3_9AGAR|nr:hypothetical protein D9758_009959 [Tetrapyrgos nigripes]
MNSTRCCSETRTGLLSSSMSSQSDSVHMLITLLASTRRRTSNQAFFRYLCSIPSPPYRPWSPNQSSQHTRGDPQKHGLHSTFHRTRIPLEEEENPGDGVTPTRFFRWHMDAALYDLNPSKVTTLYGARVPQGPKQVIRYDDGSDEVLPVPLGMTAFVSGRTMFDIFPPQYKSLVIRARAKYAPKSFEWTKEAKALSTGLGIVNEGLEKQLENLEDWDEGKRKTFPFVWTNPVSGALHFRVHPCTTTEVFDIYLVYQGMKAS